MIINAIIRRIIADALAIAAPNVARIEPERQALLRELTPQQFAAAKARIADMHRAVSRAQAMIRMTGRAMSENWDDGRIIAALLNDFEDIDHE